MGERINSLEELVSIFHLNCKIMTIQVVINWEPAAVWYNAMQLCFFKDRGKSSLYLFEEASKTTLVRVDWVCGAVRI